ncbi:MAG: 16S rRNA (cytosine(967)-C(5))-methyltransferase RsmB [Acidobacteria bacterium]|nr:16S rRNA (cytosine(967)-C(5))-methyltransferase RsmB [Acidobacteriota bacterium]MBI3424932.1 16S rRNA (cytosine(967)-C(5))-methyltransferase RsmB [Acidobacteriota bacterium]
MNTRPRLIKSQPPRPRPIEISPARRAAFDILWRVATEDAYATNLLASENYNSLSREDHGLLNELVLGVLRWQRTLDFLIERYAQRPTNKLDTATQIALRLGLYQLRWLTRIPAHAALNESVNLIKATEQPAAAPLVNAALRNATRDSATSLEEMLATVPNDLARLGIETSHPSWLLKRWLARLGETDAKELATANNTTPRTAFRFNALQADPAQSREWLAQSGIGFEPSTVAPQAFVITAGKLSSQATPVQTGALYLQDEASQLIAHLAANHPQSQISNPQCLDLCAAPGSKATLLASLLPADARIVACDLHAHRLRTMDEMRERLGIFNLELKQLDATQELPASFVESFDAVLLDAPCSGLGTLQRHPEIKWRLNEAKLKELAELQKQLIANAARCVKPGGLLTYAVCSTEPEEGEEVVAWLRAQQKEAGYEFRDMTRERLLELGLDPTNFLTGDFGGRTYPHHHGCEGFFFCVLWKRR